MKKEKNKKSDKNLIIINSLIISLLILIIIPVITAEASPWPAYNVCCEKSII